MKFKRTLTLLFFLSFTIYNLCAVLMQGDCGFAVSDARCSAPCDAETERTPQQEHPTENCCIIGLELSRPAESKLIAQLLGPPPLLATIPTLPVVPSSYHSIRRKAQHTEDYYDRLPVHSISSRAPPFFLS